MPKRRKKTLFIPQPLHTRFKVACVQAGVTMFDQVELLVRQWVQGVEERGPPPIEDAARDKRCDAGQP